MSSVDVYIAMAITALSPFFLVRNGALNVIMSAPYLYMAITAITICISGVPSYGILNFNWVALHYYAGPVAVQCALSLVPFMIIPMDGSRIKKIFLEVRQQSAAPFWLTTGAAALFAIISYPWIAGLADWRTTRLLPGDGWNGIYICSYICSLFFMDERKYSQRIASVAVPAIVMLGGERVDSLMLLPLVYWLGLLGKIRAIRSAFAGVMLFSVLVLIQFYRAGEAVSAEEYYDAILYNRTALDVLNVAYSVVAVVRDFHHELSSSVLSNYLFSLIPFSTLGGAGSPLNIGNLTDQYFPNVNGGLFASELYVVGGNLGILVGVTMLCMLIRSITAMKGEPILACLLTFLFVAFSVRVSWYGLVYIIKPIYVMLGVYSFIIVKRKLSTIKSMRGES